MNNNIMGAQLSNQDDFDSITESEIQNIKESGNHSNSLNKNMFDQLVEDGKIKQYDTLKSNSDIKLYSYTHCDNNSSQFLKNCRGLVFDKDKLVLKTLPYSDELVCSETDELKHYFQEYNMSDIKFFHSKEGTLLRLHYLDNQWRLSTFKKLDSFQSFWNSSMSFGDLFKTGLVEEIHNNNDLNKKITEQYDDGKNYDTPIIQTNDSGYTYDKDGVYNVFLDTLDKQEQYMFLVSTTNRTRIVCQYGEFPQLYFVGKYCNDDNKLSTENTTCIKMSTLRCFTSVDELSNYTESLDISKDQGIIGYLPDMKQVKVLNTMYKNLYDIRGNQPSLRFRYLQLINDTDKVKTIRNLYPEHHQTFTEIDHTLYNIAIGIYTQYCRRFIQKQYAVVPKEQYQTLKECHSWHCQDRTRNKISIHKVIDVLYSQSPVDLNRMIKMYPNYIQHSVRVPEQSFVNSRI